VTDPEYASAKHSKFEETFNQLSNELNLNESGFDKLEEFVCYLYGYREKSINSMRYSIKYSTKKEARKYFNISSMSPNIRISFKEIKRNCIYLESPHSLKSGEF
jgi:hypothetical protein